MAATFLIAPAGNATLSRDVAQALSPSSRCSLLLAWLALIFGGLASLSHAIPNAERQFLLDLYSNTIGTGWDTRTGWDSATPGTECSWHGVLCDAGNAKVLQIYLDGNNLAGTLPATITSLTALKFFYASSNQLTGAIPALNGMTELKEFLVENNALTGPIPALATLTALTRFYVNNNELTGSIPRLTGLTALSDFRVNNNQLNGAIPSLAGLTALTDFRVSRNQLTGSIPSLSGSTALRYVYLDQNRLTGSIPPLTGLTALERLYVYENRLTGFIPALTNLTRLKDFSVHNNQLSGPIPSLAGLNALERFRVEGNQLSGVIPATPSPTNRLINEDSALCPNQLTISGNAAWDLATPDAVWSSGCTTPLPGQSLGFGAAPKLAVASSGNVAATVMPSPGSAMPVVYRSLTPGVCSVDTNTRLVIVLPLAVVGDVCTITADKAGDTTHNSAPQVQQSIGVSPLCRLDINGDGTRNAQIDGLLILRHLLGFGGTSLIAGITLPPGNRTTANALEDFLVGQSFHVSGAPTEPALGTRDALVILRHMQGLPAATMIGGTDIPSANAAAVLSRIQGWCP